MVDQSSNFVPYGAPFFKQDKNFFKPLLKNKQSLVILPLLPKSLKFFDNFMSEQGEKGCFDKTESASCVFADPEIWESFEKGFIPKNFEI